MIITGKTKYLTIRVWTDNNALLCESTISKVEDIENALEELKQKIKECVKNENVPF